MSRTLTPKTPVERDALQQQYAQQRSEASLTLVLGFISIAALLWYYAHQQILLYGDAVAHINIARRVLDNRSWLSSFFQLGTVWLPLPHLLMLPFVWNRVLWMSGIAGSIASMAAYVLGGLGIYRLLSTRLGNLPAYLAVAIYALNPNLLYMQTTAMNEPLYLAFFIWAIVSYDQWLREISGELAESTRPPQRSLEGCGIALAGGAATRYDGWFFGAIMGVIVLWTFVRWFRTTPDAVRRRAMTKSLAEFLLLNALVPVFWLAYNHRVSGRAMDWANGPYSAKAIAERTTARGAAPYPGKDHIVTAGLYFLKASKLNVGPERWGDILFALALAGTGIAIWQVRQYWTWLLLWIPLIFYALSIAYGSVPIFIPTWWPFSYYNVRYGLELLPVFAVFPALLGAALAKPLGQKKSLVVWSVLAVLFGSSYLAVYASVPITLKEAQVNARTRTILEEALARFLVGLPPSSTILMYQGEHVGALQQAGIPLRSVISEMNHPDWEWALLDPAKHADYIIAFKGDPVWMAAQQHRQDLTELMAITVPEQAKTVIYRSNQSRAESQHQPAH